MKRDHIVIISASIIILFYVIISNRHSFFLFPIHGILQSPEEYEELIMENEMGCWIYPPLVLSDSNRLIIYFNGNSGNVSTRICAIQFIRRIFPDYYVANFDYPGYGLSQHLPLHYGSILKHCNEACTELIRRYDPICLGYWGESLGALIQMNVYNSDVRSPDWIVQINGVNDLKGTIGHIILWPLHILILPWIPKMKTTAELFKEQFQNTRVSKFLIFHAVNDPIVPFTQIMDLYLDVVSTVPTGVIHMNTLIGKHNNVLYIKENQELIKKEVTEHIYNNGRLQ